MSSLLFALSGFLILFGVVQQTKATLNKGVNIRSKRGIWALISKFSGFILLGYLILKYKTDALWLHMLVFVLAGTATILFYLLARRSSIR